MTIVAAGTKGCRASNRYPIIGWPAIPCMTLGREDFIRVPLPAARMTARKRIGSSTAPSGPNHERSYRCAPLPYSTWFLLVFDLDGTLVDGVPDLNTALSTVNSGGAISAAAKGDVRTSLLLHCHRFGQIAALVGVFAMMRALW